MLRQLIGVSHELQPPTRGYLWHYLQTHRTRNFGDCCHCLHYCAQHAVTWKFPTQERLYGSLTSSVWESAVCCLRAYLHCICLQNHSAATTYPPPPANNIRYFNWDRCLLCYVVPGCQDMKLGGNVITERLFLQCGAKDGVYSTHIAVMLVVWCTYCYKLYTYIVFKQCN